MYSKTLKDYVEHLRKALDNLDSINCVLNIIKVSFTHGILKAKVIL